MAFLEHRGFEAIERAKMVQLDLRRLEPPAIEPPAGIASPTLAERPDLEAGAHAVAVEAYLDIPSADEPLAAGSFAEFVARDVRRESIPPDGFMIALDSDTGEVAGWASLMYLPGSTTAAWHDMTAVGRRWRGRGVATTLKRATIAWAIERGLELPRDRQRRRQRPHAGREPQAGLPPDPRHAHVPRAARAGALRPRPVDGAYFGPWR